MSEVTPTPDPAPSSQSVVSPSALLHQIVDQDLVEAEEVVVEIEDLAQVNQSSKGKQSP